MIYSKQRLVVPYLLSLALMGMGQGARAQEFESKTLEDMLGLQSPIATKKALTTRESPGIVSIVTREEIVRSGARDLMEILNLLVPGIYVGADVEGAAGVGIRGLWGFDSRMLFLIDGVEVNEEAFGNVPLGNHYPAEMIERVEVIRGPGSVIYGGYATVGVVSVITRGAESSGYVVAGRYSQMSKTYSHRNLTVGMGDQRKDFKYNLTLSGGQGQRGEGTYHDGSGNSISTTNRTDLDPQIYNAGFEFKGFKWRGLIDKYHTNHVHYGYSPITGTNYQETWRTYATQAQYSFDLAANFRLTAKYDFKRTEPWNILDEEPGEEVEFNLKTIRHRGALQSDWNITENFSLLSGVEYSTLVVEPNRDAVLDESTRLKNEFRTLFAESNWVTDFGRIVVGGRYEDSAIVDPAFVPRFGWTKAWDRFHSKFLLARSFRSPAGVQPQVTVPGDRLKPEIATDVEFEAGYRLSERSWLVGNVFDTRVEDAIVYIAGPDDQVDNLGSLGSRGFEAEYRFKGERFNLNSSLAFYRSVATSVPSLQVPGEEGVHRGAPATRMNLHAGWKFSENFGIFPTVTYYSERYAWSREGTVKEFKPTTVANLNLRYQNLFMRGLSLNVGVMNLADADFPLLQGYDNGDSVVPNDDGTAELPHNQRALNLMLSYQETF